MAQAVNVWDRVAGNQQPSTSGVAADGDIDNPVINIRHGKSVPHEHTSKTGKHSSDCSASLVRMQTEDDMQRTAGMPVNKAGSSMYEAGASHTGAGRQGLKMKTKFVLGDDTENLQTSAQQRGCVVSGDEKDVCALLDEPAAQAYHGVICNSQVLCCDNGVYEEKKQYDICSETWNGGFGKAEVCMDKRSGKAFIRKTVEGTVEKNEVQVPLMFKEVVGILQVFGVIRRGPTTEIFLELAGLSLDKLIHIKEYSDCLRQPGVLVCLAFQAFKTLEKLHCEGIQHLDIKPHNVCVDVRNRVPFFKLIDWGSCQMPGEMKMKGLTYEYLSPESCVAYLKYWRHAQGQRLEEGTDVWAMALSLLFCLYGRHPMIYVCTGEWQYHVTGLEKEKKRVESLLKISQMTDDKMAVLLDPSWPCALKEPVTGMEARVLKDLVRRALRVDPRQRCSATEGVAVLQPFIRRHMTGTDKGAPEPSVLTSNSPVGGTPGIRLRVPTTKILPGSRPLPSGDLVPPPVQGLPPCGNPVTGWRNRPPQMLQRKRRSGGEMSLHAGKSTKK